MAYDKIPAGCSLSLTPFKAHVSEGELADFKKLIELSGIAPPTHENSGRPDGQYGVSRSWCLRMRDRWLDGYDWRKTEARINSFPNYSTLIRHKDGGDYSVHFMALFSDNPDAVPVALLHGWPGSILEFGYFLDEARAKYTPATLPYHLIVPSLPGYGWSQGGPVETEWDNETMAYILNKLMVGLGFGSGYIPHGGDIGSFLSRIMCVRYDAAKATHLHYYLVPGKPASVAEDDMTAQERKFLPRLAEFMDYGNAYAKEHGTKGGTIGLVLSSSPIALLCWVGEKYIDWTDTTPSDDDILDSVTLYWFTKSFPRAIYPYIDYFGRGANSTVFNEKPEYFCKKPMGYSYFPWELAPIPLSWAKTTGNIVWHKYHDSGGHFAALEKPKELFQDLEEFVGSLDWNKVKQGVY